jgi:hypothetical protein
MQQDRSADVVPISVLEKAVGITLEAAAGPKRRPGAKRYTRKQTMQLQTTLAKALSDLKSEPQRPGVMFTSRNRAASLLQAAAAQTPEKRLLKNGALEAVFDDDDWHYRKDTVAAKILFPRRFQWVQPPRHPEGELPKQFRAAVFGDWGTAMYGAPLVRDCIEKDPSRIDLIIHLGDTYYAGYPNEVKGRLLTVWPKRNDAISRSLNGNHEMYAGGVAYKKALPKLGQRSSCFWFQNDDWVLIGLDTSYGNYIYPWHFDLNESQIDWLNKVIVAAEERRILLFSHHYLFSAFESFQFSSGLDKPFAMSLIETMRQRVAMKQFYAWYWGHEHRCTIYDWSDEWALFGRCIGHGGFPYFRDKTVKPPRAPRFFDVKARNFAPACIVLDGANPTVAGYENEYGPHGYLMLEFDGAKMTERVCDVHNGGQEIWAKGHKAARRK